MTIPTEVKACIDKHLQAVRANLSDKEESIQDEILEGLRDHINEALARDGKPVTMATVEAILAAMDDPASYAEEPSLAGAAAVKRGGGMTGNKWLYVAMAFLLINSIGVWKLIQIERKTGTGNASNGNISAGNSQVLVPNVASGDKSGIRYPGADEPAAPRENPEAKAPAPAESSFRSVAFMENRNPVLQQSDQELSWRFSADVVAQGVEGKPLAEPPIKLNPAVPGEFIWKSPAQLVFKPKNPWRLDQSFTAELAREFRALGGETYDGTRLWRFSTVGFELEKFAQSPKPGAFLFNLTFSLPVKADSLSEKLKLFYLNANGEKLPLEFTLKFDAAGTTAAIETPIVPAVSFVCEIAANLQSPRWPDGTRGKIERKLPNSQLLSLAAASLDQRPEEKPAVTLVFSEVPSDGNPADFIAIAPKVKTVLTRTPGRPEKLCLTGDFVAGTAYEIKVKSGLTSLAGSVLPFTTTRSVVLAPPAGAGIAQAVPGQPSQPFEAVLFMAGRQTVLDAGNQQLRWKFSCPVVAKEIVGQTLKEAPIKLSPNIEGSFFWTAPNELAFKPNLEWDLNQSYEARLAGDLANLAGTKYSGVRFWTFTTPAMTILTANQMGGGRGFRFSLGFSMIPDADSLKQHLKVFCYTDVGSKNYLPFVVENESYPAINKLISVPAAPTCRLYFELEPGFRPAKWTQGIKDKVEVAAVISTVLRVVAVTQSGGAEKTPSIRVQFSESVDVKTAAAFIEINPPLKFTVQLESGRNMESGRNATLRLLGPFVPHRDYQVKVRAGLVSENGYILVNESSSTVAITRAAAALGFAGAGGYLSPAGSLLVPITAQNLTKCMVSVAPVMASNLVYFARRNSADASYNLPEEAAADKGRSNDSENHYEYGGRQIEDIIGNVTHKEVKLAGELNVETTNYLNLHDYTKSKGAYLVQLRALDAENANSYRRHLSDSRLVVVTDLGISAKCSASHVFVWVCSLKDAKPAGGVEVTAYSANNQWIGEALTSADGIAAIPCNTRDKNRTPFLIAARAADDLSYLRLDRDDLQAEGTESTREYRSAGCEAFLFTDRGIFRPGETLHARTFIRKADFTAPAAFPVVFQIIKPDGRMFKEIAAMPNAFGAAEVETIMPDYLPTGSYTIRLRVPQAKEDMGTRTFLLEDFVPPQIRVSVTTDPERVTAGGKLTANILAEHLFGAPAAGLKANMKCIYTPVAFAPKPWSEYRFGIQTAAYWGSEEANPFAMKPQDIDNLVLDNEGKVTAEIATAIPAKAPGPIQALVQASVFEQSGRAITATKTTVIDPYPFYIGVKRPAVSWLKSGENHKISVITVRPDGEACKPEKPLTVRISHLDWNYSYKRTPGGSYTYEGHKVVTLLKEEVLDLSSGAAEYSFIPTGYGQNEISIVDPDSGSTSSFSFYASDYEQSWTTTQRDKPDSLSLKLDKPEYPIGETAKLTIQAPFSGTALLTVESDKVLQSRVIFLEKNTAVVDVEVKDGYAPNVHCTVSVIRPAVAESVWKGHRAFGSIPLKVSPRNHRIHVAVEVPQTILPQSKLRTKVLLKDDAGKPVDGEVTLIAVDEAICMLTSFKTPSPLAWLYETRRLGVDSHDVYAELMEVFDESVLTKKSNPGGGDEGETAASEHLTKRLNPIKANRFKPVSLWASKVAVTNGVAEVELDVPEFTGELRVMAIACNARQLGSAQGVVKVKRPLIVQPSLPRFLAPGDECLMDVTVFNEMGKDITAKLQITCGGPLSTKLNERNIDLKTGASASVSIPMVAGNLPGKALCTVSCEAGSVRFSDTIEIAVRPPVSAEVIADSGSLTPGKSVEIRAPANWLPESVLRQVQVSKEPTLELGQGLQYLMRYPYGCIEQTTSGAFPLLYLPELANRTFDKNMGKESVRDYVMAGVWRILSMQQANGGFSYWPGFNEPCPWGTSYATHFLIEAKKAGYEVPQGCLDRALKALREGLESNTHENSNDLRDYDQRAYACYVLAIAGEPEHAWQARMLEMKDKLSYYARLMNASALLVQGEPKRAVVLLKELGLPGAGERDQGGCFNSSNRNAALLLSAWLDIDPKNDDVMKLVQFLSKTKINGYWGTTQDNAMVLMALGKYAQRIKRESLVFKGSITLPNGTTEEFDQTKDLKWEIARNEAGIITLTNRGPGNLFYSFQAEGVPIDLPEYYKKLTAKNQGMSVKREWLDDEGNPIDITELKQNDLVVARITLDPNGHSYENIAIEDLLPAGLEIENPNLDTAQSLPWLKDKFDWCARRDIRDDRILLFTRPVSGPSVFCYLARAVTPGKFIVPPVSAECMYEPDVRSVNSQSEMMITK